MAIPSSSDYARLNTSQAAPPSSIICPITNDIMDDPCIDGEGHSFGRAAILDWLKISPTCPIDRRKLTPDALVPNRALKGMIDDYQLQESRRVLQDMDQRGVPQPFLEIEQNDTFALQMITAGQDLEKKVDLEGAEKLYVRALQFTSKSEDYAHLPRIFEAKGQKKRAAVAYAVLADIQLKEDKHIHATASLKKSLTLVADSRIKEKLGIVLKDSGENQAAKALFIELAQEAYSNKDNLRAKTFCHQALDAFPGQAETWKILATLEQNPRTILEILLKGSKELTMPIKERVRLCKEILLKDPEHVQGQLLLLQLNQLRMKEKIKQLKQELSQRPLPPTASLQTKQKSTSSATSSDSIAVGKGEWVDAVVTGLPPYPIELMDFLAGPCPIWKGKTAKETHIVVPLFPSITMDVNGFSSTSLRTLATLDELEKAAGGNGLECDFKYDSIKSSKEFHYAVMTKEVLPSTRYESFDAQKKDVEPIGYEVPSALDVATALLWEYRGTGNRHCQFPDTRTRCIEQKDGNQITVGFSINSGNLNIASYRAYGCGVVGLRKF